MRSDIFFFFFLFIVGNAQVDQRMENLIDKYVAQVRQEKNVSKNMDFVTLEYWRYNYHVSFMFAHEKDITQYVLYTDKRYQDEFAIYCEVKDHTIQGFISKPLYTIFYTLECTSTLWTILSKVALVSACLSCVVGIIGCGCIVMCQRSKRRTYPAPEPEIRPMRM